MKYDVILPNHKFEKLQKLANFNKSQIKKEVSNQKKLIIAKYQNMLDAKDNEVLSLEDALLHRDKHIEFLDKSINDITKETKKSFEVIKAVNDELSKENTKLSYEVIEINSLRYHFKTTSWIALISTILFLLSLMFSDKISNL